MNAKLKKFMEVVFISSIVIVIGFMLNAEKFSVVGESSVRFSVTGDKATMTGVINAETVNEVEKLIKNNPKVKTIVMRNVPGSMDDEANLRASRLIRKHELNTHIPADGMVASGGTDFFLAGKKRTIEEGAEIGVHSWAGSDIEDASKLPKDHKEHKKYLKYYKDMGISEEFYWFTLKVAPANDIHMMTKEEIKRYKLVTS